MNLYLGYWRKVEKLMKVQEETLSVQSLGKDQKNITQHPLSWNIFVSGAPCLPEMFRLLACWKGNAFDDAYCKEEVQAFMDCASHQVQVFKSFKNLFLWTKVSRASHFQG